MATLLAFILGACAAPESKEVRAARDTIVKTALGVQGAPYRYGALGPEAFDCSGLVLYSYRAAGLSLPRTSTEMMASSTHIRLSRARPGDLLFYRFWNRRRPTMHVGIYLGDGRMIHAPSSGGVVETLDIRDTPWPKRFLTAAKVLP